jgi:hypothetical protein
MKFGFRLLTVATFIIFFWRPAFAQEAHTVDADTLEVHFRVGQSVLDLSYMDNKEQIDHFVARVREHFADQPEKSLKLDIYSGSSPEGPAELNRRLGEQRGLALREILLARLGDLLEQVTIVNQGARWGSLYSLIAASDEPWRDDVLHILAHEPEDDVWTVDPREAKLRKYRNGSVWTQIAANYLTELRSSGSAVIAPVIEHNEWVSRRDTLIIRDTIIYLPEQCPCPRDTVDLSPVWALKTNLVEWGLLAPNVQAEFPIGTSNLWSIEAELFCPWWIWNHNANARQCLNVGVEGRYWLGNRAKHSLLDGWHVGLGLGVGYYDIEQEAHHGYQGEYINLYGNIGYQHRFGRRKQFGIDAGVGLGWIPTQYREYLGSSIFPPGHEESWDAHLMWQRSDSRHILGATHANVSLIYFFHTKKQNK